MGHVTPAVAVILTLVASSAGAAPMLWNGKLPIPPSFKVTLDADRPAYLLGENVLVHYRLENTGTAPFKIMMGGDTRNEARRQDRFHVTATRAADGVTAPDPFPDLACMGGLGGGRTLAPGEAYEVSLPVMRYIHFPGPGEYTIRVRHDFDWDAAAIGDKTVAEAKVRLTAPTAEEAQQVFLTMFANQVPPVNGSGKRSEPFGDFSTLRYAPYLPMIVDELAKKQLYKEFSTQLFSALARTPDAKAVSTLLDMCEGKTGEPAARVAAALVRHVPVPPAHARQRPSNHFPADGSWDAKFARSVRELAARLTTDEDDECVATGAEMLWRIGTPEDLPVVITALDRLIPQSTLPAPPYLSTLANKRRNTDALVGAAGVLIERGAATPHDPQRPGEIAAYLASLGVRKELPADAPKRLTTWVGHDLHYLREMALARSPLPPPEGVRKRLPSLITDDPDVYVRIAAMQVATKTKAVECRAAVEQRLKAKASEWETRSAKEAIESLDKEAATPSR